MSQKLVTVGEVAKALGMGVQTVEKHMAGIEPAVVIGRSKGYALEEVQDVFWAKSAPLLSFLGLSTSRQASYDVLVDTDTTPEA